METFIQVSEAWFQLQVLVVVGLFTEMKIRTLWWSLRQACFHLPLE